MIVAAVTKDKYLTPTYFVDGRQNPEIGPAFTRYSQSLRASRTLVHLWIAAVLSISYVLFLNDTPNHAVAVWILFILAGGALREKICLRVRDNLNGNTVDFEANELSLHLGSYIVSALVGAGFWIVAWSGDTSLIIAVLLASVLYATGSTVILSSHLQSCAISLAINLAQGILFFITFRPTGSIVFAVTLGCLWFVLFEFAKQNRKLISESIRMQVENRDMVDMLHNSRETIRHAFHQALAFEQDRYRFLSAASHDLRQPLHAMGLYVGMLNETAKDDYQKELIDCISQSDERLKSQIESILQLSKLEAAAITAEKQSFDINLLLEEIVVSFTPQVELKGLRLLLNSTSRIVETDPLLLDRLIRNIVENSIRYTEAGLIEISLTEKNNVPLVVVADSGVGISKERLPDIFDEYVRLPNDIPENKIERDRGVGLGLAIVKRISSLLGITIQVQSKEGAGTTFEIPVPNLTQTDPPQANDGVEIAQKSEASFPDADSVEVPDFDGMSVLIVDDDYHNVDALTHYVMHRNGRAMSAFDWSEVDASVLDNEIGFLIVDDQLGKEYSGLDIAKKFSKSIDKKRILMMSGAATVKRIQEVNHAGFTMLHKPVARNVLDNEIVSRIK